MALLRVRAVGTALVTDYDRLQAGIRRFVGRRLDVEKGGFVPLDAPDEVSACTEHIMAVRDGDLEVADKATADLCGVPFKKSE